MNRKEKIEFINSFKSNNDFKDKKYTDDNLLTLSIIVESKKDEITEEEYSLMKEFVELAKSNQTLNSAVIVDSMESDPIDSLMKRKKIILDEAIYLDRDGEEILLSDEQLDKIYEKAIEKSMNFEAECILMHNRLSNYKDEFIEDRISELIDEGDAEDEDEAEGLALEAADDLEGEADVYVGYLLSDESSKYHSFDVKEITDDDDIIFMIKDKISNLLDGYKFSEVNEPVISNPDIVVKVTLTCE